MKIYDSFTFYNELDLLELRLTELYDHVDHFVIVEANQTFTNRTKPFNFEQHQDRYSQFLDKIIYIKVDDMPGDTNPWNNEFWQRNAILRGLDTAEENDIVIVSDVDEIPRPAAIDYMRDSDQTIFALCMPIFNFKFNYMKTNASLYDVWAMAARCEVFHDIKPNSLREMRFEFFNKPYQFSNNGCEVIEHGGWHFSYMGDTAYLIDKAQSFSHQEVNRPDFIAQIDVDASIREGKSWDRSSAEAHHIVELDDYFPQTVVNTPEKWQNYILSNSTGRAIDLLPKYPYNQ
jgi:hypothetical protein